MSTAEEAWADECDHDDVSFTKDRVACASCKRVWTRPAGSTLSVKYLDAAFTIHGSAEAVVAVANLLSELSAFRKRAAESSTQAAQVLERVRQAVLNDEIAGECYSELLQPSALYKYRRKLNDLLNAAIRGVRT